MLGSGVCVYETSGDEEDSIVITGGKLYVVDGCYIASNNGYGGALYIGPNAEVHLGECDIEQPMDGSEQTRLVGISGICYIEGAAYIHNDYYTAIQVDKSGKLYLSHQNAYIIDDSNCDGNSICNFGYVEMNAGTVEAGYTTPVWNGGEFWMKAGIIRTWGYDDCEQPAVLNASGGKFHMVNGWIQNTSSSYTDATLYNAPGGTMTLEEGAIRNTNSSGYTICNRGTSTGVGSLDLSPNRTYGL